MNGWMWRILLGLSWHGCGEAMRQAALVLSAAWLLTLLACEPSVDVHVQRLLTEGDDDATRELLLARERAVEPLLAAFADSGAGHVHYRLTDVLFGLQGRIDDSRIVHTLERALLADREIAPLCHVAAGRLPAGPVTGAVPFSWTGLRGRGVDGPWNIDRWTKINIAFAVIL